MKGIVIVHEGTEEVASSEVKELIERESNTEKTVAIFDSNEKDLEKLCYEGRSFIKVLKFISSFEFKDDFFEKLEENLTDVKVGKSFRGKCKRIGKHDFLSHDVEKEIGSAILKNNKTKVDLEEPEDIVYCYIFENKCYLGIDVSLSDLSKRDYKIFVHPASIKGTLAYSLLRIGGYSGKEIIVDPFCGSGTIPIEASLFAMSKSVHYYSKNKFPFGDKLKDDIKERKGKIYGYDLLLKHILAARKNTKIAGAEIEFSKVDISWLDTKFDEGSVDIIVTDPPRLSKHFKEKDYRNLMKELFYQAKYLIKKGNITLLTNKKSLPIMEEEAKRYNFLIDKFIKSSDELIVKFVKED